MPPSSAPKAALIDKVRATPRSLAQPAFMTSWKNRWAGLDVNAAPWECLHVYDGENQTNTAAAHTCLAHGIDCISANML